MHNLRREPFPGTGHGEGHGEDRGEGHGVVCATQAALLDRAQAQGHNPSWRCAQSGRSGSRSCSV